MFLRCGRAKLNLDTAARQIFSIFTANAISVWMLYPLDE